MKRIANDCFHMKMGQMNENKSMLASALFVSHELTWHEKNEEYIE